METRAHFFRRNTPIQQKTPKIAKPAISPRIAISMDRAGGGMAIALDGGTIVNPTIAPSVSSIVKRLISIPAIAAATTELDGLEGLIGQLYTISAGGRIERPTGRTGGVF